MGRSASRSLVLAAALAASAHADPSRARQLYADGEAAFSTGQYLNAATAFEAAFAESRKPRLLYNVAQSYRKQFDLDHDPAHLRHALAVYRNFRELSNSGADRAEAEAAIEEVSKLLESAEKAVSGDAVARSRQLYADGEAAFDAGDYSHAIKAFEATFAASRQPALLWNVAQSYRKQFEIDHDLATLRRARTVYRNYLELSPSASDRAEAESAAREVEGEIARHEKAAAERAAAEREAAERASAERRFSAEEAVRRAPAPRSRVAAFTLIGTGAALLAAGMTFSLLAGSAVAEVNHTGAPGMPAPFANEADNYARAPTYSLLSYIGYGVGAAALISGATWAILRRPPSKAKRVSLFPTAGGVVLVGAW